MRYTILFTALTLFCCLAANAQKKFPNKKEEVKQILDSTLERRNYKYKYIDIDKDGCSEMLAQDKDGNRCVVAWNGKKFTVAYLGYWKYSTSYSNGVICSGGSTGTGAAMEYVVTIKKSKIVYNMSIFKLYNPQTDDIDEELNGGDNEMLDEARKLYKSGEATAIDFDNDEWQPFDYFCGEAGKGK